MWNKLSKLSKHLTIAIPISMVLGILFGYFFEPSFLKSLILPLTILMIYPMMVTLNIKKALTYCRPRTQIIIQSINFIIIPMVGFGIGLLFLKDKPLLAYGLFLIALLPTSGMTISWTGFAKGNVNIAIKTTMVGLILGSLLMPLYTKTFMSQVIDLPLVDTFIELGKVIFLPLLLGYATQVILKKKFGEVHFNQNIKKKFPLLATLAVLGIIFVAMSLKARSIVSNPFDILYLIVPLSIFYGINYSVSSIFGRLFLQRDEAIALVYGTAMRNLSVALAITLTVFGEKGADIALIIAVAYVMQVQSAAWYIKLSGKIFGNPPEDTAKDVMEEGVFALHQNSTLQDAIMLLDEEHIHSIAVIDGTNKPFGMITSQIIINLLAEGVKSSIALGSVELLPIIEFKETTSINKVIKTMKNKHQYKVLIIDENGKMKGVVTEMDILDKYANK